MKFGIDVSYHVTVPDKGTEEYESILVMMLEDSEFSDNFIDVHNDSTQDDYKDYWVAEQMAYYMMENFHAGDFTDRVVQVDDQIDEL